MNKKELIKNRFKKAVWVFYLLAILLFASVDVLYFDKVPFYTIIIIIVYFLYNVIFKNIRQ